LNELTPVARYVLYHIRNDTIVDVRPYNCSKIINVIPYKRCNCSRVVNAIPYRGVTVTRYLMLYHIKVLYYRIT